MGTVAQLPLSLQNLVVENVAIEECALRPAFTGAPQYGNNRPFCDYTVPNRTVCFRGIDTKKLQTVGAKLLHTKQLILCDWPTRTFDPLILTKLVPHLERFALTGRTLQRLVHHFPPLSKLRELNITGTRLNHTDANTFYELEQLKVLNLRGNELEQIQQYRFLSDHVDIYLQGNYSLLATHLQTNEHSIWLFPSHLQEIPGTVPTT